MTKAQYEQKLSPLLNNVVVPALRVAFNHGGIANPQRLAAAITVVRLAHDQMAAVTPPGAVADLHQRTVTVLASTIGDMTKLREAETKRDTSGASSAVRALESDARNLESVGGQFTSRGY